MKVSHQGNCLKPFNFYTTKFFMVRLSEPRHALKESACIQLATDKVLRQREIFAKGLINNTFITS